MMMDNDLVHLDFVIYCIETYKSIKNLDGRTAYKSLKDAGAIEYIDENYDALHTFGDENIVWNIDEYLRHPFVHPEENEFTSCARSMIPNL
jgi:hypothetical protein